MGITVPDIPLEPVQAPREQASGSLESFGGGAGLEQIGQEGEKLASQAGDIAAFEKIRADQTAVQEASAKLSQIHTQLLYDPDNGVLTSQGTNAMKAHDDAWTKYRKAANDIAGTLHGQTQQGAFNKQALAMGDAFNQTAMAHVSQQLEKHDESTFKSLVSNQTQLAAFGYGNDHQVALSYGMINDAAAARAKRMGLDSDQTQEMMRNIHSNFHEQVLSQMVNDPKFQDKAATYFEATKGDMDADTRDRVTKVLTEGTTRSDAQAQAQAILSKNKDSESDALAAADKISDPATQDMTRKIISTTFGQNRQAEHNDQDETFLKMGQMVDQKKLSDPVDIRQAVPVSAWEKMTAAQRTALLKRGEETVTSPRKWLDFMDNVKNGTVTGLSRADLEEKYLPYFDSGDKKRAMDMWVTGKKGPGSARLMSDESTQKAIETTLVNSGLVRTDWRKHSGDQKLMYQFDGDVHNDIIALEKSQNKSPTPADVQKIVDDRTKQYYRDNVVKVNTNAPWPNSQKAVSLMSDKEKGEAYVPHDRIPTNDVATLEGLMRQANRPVTRSKTTRAYAAYLMGDRQRLRQIVNE